MTNGTTWTDIQTAWINFVKSVRGLLVPQADDRPLDQYLEFRDAVLTIVEGEQFLADLNTGWGTAVDEIRKALLLELRVFPRAVEVAQATTKVEERQGWLNKMLGRASTVSGSVKDLIDNLPPYVKSALTLFNELVELFKGKD